MEEINHLLNYENLKIVQNRKGFKYSLDSVLLAHFASIQHRQKRILDIGTGNAPIPLLLSTRTNAKIIGIEIQEESYILAKKTIRLNKLEEKIQIIYGDVNEWYKQTESDTFDLIVCNPPFFKMNKSSITNDDKQKQIARHEMTLNLDNIFKISKKLLKNNGRIALVHRPERFIEIIDIMRSNNIEPKKIRFVYPYKKRDANMLLIEGVKNGNAGLKVLDPLYIYDDNMNYTHEVQSFLK